MDMSFYDPDAKGTGDAGDLEEATLNLVDRQVEEEPGGMDGEEAAYYRMSQTWGIWDVTAENGQVVRIVENVRDLHHTLWAWFNHRQDCQFVSPTVSPSDPTRIYEIRVDHNTTVTRKCATYEERCAFQKEYSINLPIPVYVHPVRLCIWCGQRLDLSGMGH